MPTFTYVARDNAGARVQGQLSAANSIEAAKLLRNEGKFVVSLSAGATPQPAGRVIPPNPAGAAASGVPAGAPPQPGFFAAKPKPVEVRNFANQLSVMLETGVPLNDALDTCVDAKNTQAFAAVLNDVIAQVQGGTTLSAALARHPRVFSNLFVNMVRASEASGQLGRILRRIADFLTNQHEMSRKIKGALAYPAVMLVMAIGVTIFLMTFVLPKFANIYAGREDKLPVITRFFMGMSHGLRTWGPWAGGGLVALIVVGIIYYRRPASRAVMDAIKLRLPLLGGLFRKTYLARSLRTLGSLVQAGVSMLDAVELTGSAVSNAVFSKLWATVHERLNHGQQLSDCLMDSSLVPRPVTKMLGAGERGGKLGPVMDMVATHCEEEVATDVKTVTSLIEPVIVMFLGIVVGGIVIALLLPIFTLSKAMKG